MYVVKPRVLPRHASPKPKMWLMGSHRRSTSRSSSSGRVALEPVEAVDRHVAVGERHALGVAAGAAGVEHHPRLIERDGVHRALEGARVLAGRRARPTARRRDHGRNLRSTSASGRHLLPAVAQVARRPWRRPGRRRAARSRSTPAYASQRLQHAGQQRRRVDEDHARVGVLDDVRRLLRRARRRRRGPSPRPPPGCPARRSSTRRGWGRRRHARSPLSRPAAVRTAPPRGSASAKPPR